MEYQQTQNQIIVRLVKGEQVMDSLKSLVRKLDLKGGFFVGLGAVEQTTLGYFSLSDKTYHKKTLDQALEITNITGNISYFEDELVIHAHTTLSDQEMNSFGGHLFEATVSGTFEAIIFITPNLNRTKDTELGLNLLHLDHKFIQS